MSARRPSSAKRHGLSEGDFRYDCKAAYLCVVDDLTDELTSKKQLLTALQQSGRNPCKKDLDRYWRSSTESLSFEDFCEVCRKEPATTKDDLMKAFRKIDINGDGYLSHSELYKVMTTKGEPMTREEVKEMIDEVDENHDGKLDYKEFCNFLLSTTNSCKEMTKERLESKSSRKVNRPSSARSDDRSPRDRKNQGDSGSRTTLKSAESSAKNFKHTAIKDTAKNVSKTQIRKSTNSPAPSGKRISTAPPTGSDDDDDIIIPGIFSTSKATDTPSRVPPKPKPRKISQVSADAANNHVASFKDETPKPSPRAQQDEERVFGPISTKKVKVQEPRRLKDWSRLHSKGCFFLESDGIVSHQYTMQLSSESSVWLSVRPTDLSTPVTDTAVLVLRDRPGSAGNRLVTFTEQRDMDGKFCVRCDLQKGRYALIPFTTGCRLKRRRSEPRQEKLVSQNKDNAYSLTKAFKDTLSDIFDISDLDGNGLMSREEFNWYTIRTSGEPVGDEEWEVVEENVELKNGELTKKGFIELNQMEADDAAGDTDDLWVTLSSMGYNRGLVMDEAAPFDLEVYTEEKNSGTLKVKAVTSLGSVIEKAICEYVMGKGESRRVRNMKDLFLHVYAQDFRTTLVLENKSNSSVKVCLDCGSSQNCVGSLRSLDGRVTVAARSIVVACHLMPDNEKREWSFKCQETIMK